MEAKNYLLAILILTASTNTWAQKTHIRVGLKAGVNFSKFNPSVLPAPITRLKDDNGFYAGGRLEVKFNKYFTLQPEIFYIDSRVQDYDEISYLMTETVKHISLPVLAKLNLGHLGLFAGPQLSYMIQSEVKYFDNSSYDPKEATLDVTDSSYRKLNFSGVVGMEYIIGYNFGFDLRYQFGLSNIRADNGATLLTYKQDQSIKLGGIQAGIFIRFGNRPEKKK